MLFLTALLVFLSFERGASTKQKTRAVLLFGDSFTDQSRQHSIQNGTYPGKNYQEVYPPTDSAADGGVQWPWYLGLYGNVTIWNYAVGGAVCSNDLTPLYDSPDVLSGQAAWFIQDHIAENGTLTLNPSEFTVVIFIGTNDVGINSFLTGDQKPNVTLSSVANCQLQAIRNLHALGARHFILNSLLPLQSTGLYRASDVPTIYWPFVHNGTEWNERMRALVHGLNSLLKEGAAQLSREWHTYASVEYFDTYALYEDMITQPGNFYNGSIPPDVVGHCHQCPNASDYRQCGIGDCTLAERDSYMFWDELHPSEQSGRNLAREIWNKILGRSKY